MLVLTRKTNEEIVIGNDIRITIVEVAPGRVKLGISAPRHVRVDRAEIHEKKLGEQEAVMQQADVPVVVNRVADMLPPPVEVAEPLPSRIRSMRRIKPR
jgi:carbon storage regulator